jgi:hypothetical protein
MNPHRLLLQLQTPDVGRFGTLPQAKYRPLGAFSDFVCDELGTQNQRVRQGSISAGELREVAESRAQLINLRGFPELLEPARQIGRRVALLDLVWVLRSLDVAHLDDPHYRERKKDMRIFRLARGLATMENRHPVLCWSDIAIYHPIYDPRTFLAPGPARDEEILMYRVQNIVENIFKRIIESDWNQVTPHMLSDLVLDINAALEAVVHFSRARTVGQFDELDPYLSVNFEYRGHATGAFSAWTYLMGVFLAKNHSFESRLVDRENAKAFDLDARPHIDKIRTGEFKHLATYLASSPLVFHERKRASHLYYEACRAFMFLLYCHRGAIKRHASASFQDQSPADPERLNLETIDEAIADMTVPGRRRSSRNRNRLA